MKNSATLYTQLLGNSCPIFCLHFLPKRNDKDRISDRAYVWSVVLENLDMVEGWEAVYVIDEEFVASAKEGRWKWTYTCRSGSDSDCD